MFRIIVETSCFPSGAVVEEKNAFFILTAVQNHDPPITTEEFIYGMAKAYDLLSQHSRNESSISE